MRKVWRALVLVLTLNCEQSAQLVSESLDRDLSRVERLALFFHFRVCRSSRELARQIRMLHQQAAAQPLQLEGSSAGASQNGLSPEARARISRAIGKQG